jgi:hypothetical protein
MRLPPHLAGMVAGFAAILAGWAALFAAQVGFIGSESRWTYDMLKAKEAMVSRAGHPAILVAGGSGALFDIRADRLGELLDARVVNVGTYAALGLTGLLGYTRSLARPGDIILLSLEYELYGMKVEAPRTAAAARARARTIQARVAAWGREANAMMAMSLPRVLEPWTSRLVKRDVLDLYQAPSHLDAVGDTLGNNAVLKDDAVREKLRGLAPPPIALGRENADHLRAFAAWAKARGVRVLATHPSVADFPGDYARPEVRSALARIEELHAALDMPFVDRFEDGLYPVEALFDTAYHLDSVAARIRTERLARALAGRIPAGTYGPALRWPAPSHPLAVLDRDFRGWAPLAGFGKVERPGPRREGAATIQAFGPQSVMQVQSAEDRVVAMAAEAQPAAAGQQLEIRVNGVPAAHFTFADAGRFEPLSAKLRLHAGINDVTLVQGGAGAAPSLRLRRWTFDPAPMG